LIILDTNVLPRHGSLGGPVVALVRAIAQKTGHKVALPAIVVEESVAELTRELSKAWDKAKVAAEALTQFFPGYRIDQPNLAKCVEQWQADLKRSFTILDAPPGAANEALHREAHRILPTRSAGPKGSGSGARDALIWLTVLDAHRREPANGATYFVTNNPVNFGHDKLLPPLQQEVDGVATTAPFHYLNSMTGLLEELAAPAGEGPTEYDLLASDQLRVAVEEVLRSIDIVGGDHWRPATAITPSSPSNRPRMTRVSLRNAEAATAYQVGAQRFAAVSTVWDGVSIVSMYLGAEPGGGGGVSQELTEYYTTRLLLLVELGDDGRVRTADVVSAEPFVYERTDVRTIE
jgi:hypothetical protein